MDYFGQEKKGTGYFGNIEMAGHSSSKGLPQVFSQGMKVKPKRKSVSCKARKSKDCF